MATLKKAEPRVRVNNLAARVAALEEENQALRAFAAQAAHELAQPLLVAEAYAGLACAELRPDQAEIRDMLQRLGRSAMRARLLVDALLLDNVQARGARQNRPVDLAIALDSALELLAPDIRSTGTTVEYELLPVVPGDEASLVAVMRNLLANAIRYGPVGPSATIRVSAEQLEDEWAISVDSRGPELTERERERIFEPFSRGRGRRRVPGVGLGLGLTICRNVVERHGGRLWATTTPEGDGNRFTFTLPMRCAERRRAAS